MTLAEQVYHQMRQDIVSGALRPGQPLRLEAMRARYGAGFSPLREALMRLQGERLVDQIALRGFTVALLSLPQMWDAVETRILIEQQALRLSIAHGGDDWETGVVAALHALTLAADRGDTGAALEDRHRAFHLALIAACRSEWLLDFAAKLYAATDRYRYPALASVSIASARNLRVEHAQLAEAALARTPDAACVLLDGHYRRTATALACSFDPERMACAG
ncbi:MAG: FCD domain-containing protein [Gemmobacter sp.]|nr:FCD domain-containing protein [Gemmobacter sp.]